MYNTQKQKLTIFAIKIICSKSRQTCNRQTNNKKQSCRKIQVVYHKTKLLYPNMIPLTNIWHHHNMSISKDKSRISYTIELNKICLGQKRDQTTYKIIPSKEKEARNAGPAGDSCWRVMNMNLWKGLLPKSGVFGKPNKRPNSTPH